MSEPEILTIQSHKGPYDVHFDEQALQKLNENVRDDVHFIIDQRVADLYATQMDNILAASSVLRIKAIEGNKSLELFPGYVQHLTDHGLRRDHMLVAIGGGIIQDITCFLAATILRGVEWMFYPTTLLSQADSCIGSKSSINCGDTKNILGTFTPPSRIYISANFLQTLDEKDVRSGVGEMLKVHVIDGPDSFDDIAAVYTDLFKDSPTLIRYIKRSLEIKKAYIETDEFDKGPRNIFNYGHSFGHAIEAATRFTIPHGIAITIGMDLANYVSWKLGVGIEQHYRRMHPALRENYKGFEDYRVPLEKFFQALSKDKKNIGAGSVTLILPDEEGLPFRGSYPSDESFNTLCATYLEQERSGF